MSKTIDIQIEKSQNLIKGLRRHISEHGEKDFAEKEIALIEANINQLKSVSDEVTRLREELAPKVKHMNDILDAVKESYKENKQKLKAFYPQEQWEQYGIPDKR